MTNINNKNIFTWNKIVDDNIPCEYIINNIKYSFSKKIYISDDFPNYCWRYVNYLKLDKIFNTKKIILCSKKGEPFFDKEKNSFSLYVMAFSNNKNDIGECYIEISKSNTQYYRYIELNVKNKKIKCLIENYMKHFDYGNDLINVVLCNGIFIFELLYPEFRRKHIIENIFNNIKNKNED